MNNFVFDVSLNENCMRHSSKFHGNSIKYKKKTLNKLPDLKYTNTSIDKLLKHV